MRRVWISGLAFLLTLSGAVVAPQQAAAHGDDFEYCEDDDLGSEVAVGYFRDDLTPHGRWFRIPAYGWAWRPFGVAADWRPYTRGRWIDTDYGWTWVSDEPWGWAPYHYGRWAWDERYGGWIWVPGRCWSPAWVDWREGGGYLGWAPLPPAARWRRGVGIPTRTIVIQPHHYCFVETRRVIEPQVSRFAAPPARNVTIIRNTTNVTNYTIVNNRVANHSVRQQTIERATGQPLPRYPIAEIESAAPRAFPGRPGAHEQPPKRSVHEAPSPAADPRGVADVDRDRRKRIDAEREQAAIEQRNAQRLQDESRRREALQRQQVERHEQEVKQREDLQRQEVERHKQEVKRREDLERSREAAHERDAQREALQRQQVERHKQEVKQREDLERSREAAARQETMRREQAERAREAAEHKARADALQRQQAEAQRHAAPQPQRQPPTHVDPRPLQPQHQPPPPIGPRQAPAARD